MLHVSLLDEASWKAKTVSVGLKSVPVVQDGEVRVTCVRDELVRDMWHVITGFSQDDRMKPNASRAAIIWVGFLRAGPGFH